MPHLLAEVIEESTTYIDAGLGLTVWLWVTTVVFVTMLPALVTSVLTRQWDIVLVGLVTFGLAWYVGLYRTLRGTARPVRWVRDPPASPTA